MGKYKLLFVLLITMLVVGCSADKAELAQLNCTIAIATDTEIILEPIEVSFSDGETVLDVLKRVTREKKIQMEYTGTDSMAYVNGINNVYEFDKGPESGWLYSVNDVDPQVGCGSYKIKEGDVIQWKYMIEFTTN